MIFAVPLNFFQEGGGQLTISPKDGIKNCKFFPTVGPCTQLPLSFQLTESRCSGRQQCGITVPDVHFDETLPCNEDLKSYLEVRFKCLKGEKSSSAFK